MERATYFQGKGEEPHWQRERGRNIWCKMIRTSERAEDSRSVLELRGKRCERQVRQRWRKERQVQRCWSTCVESKLEVQLRARWRRLHRRRKQAQRLVRLSRLNAQRWICATTMARQEVVSPRWIAFNVDTGAGGTVWPMNADYACKKNIRSSRSQLQDGEK